MRTRDLGGELQAGRREILSRLRGAMEDEAVATLPQEGDTFPMDASGWICCGAFHGRRGRHGRDPLPLPSSDGGYGGATALPTVVEPPPPPSCGRGGVAVG